VQQATQHDDVAVAVLAVLLLGSRWSHQPTWQGLPAELRQAVCSCNRVVHTWQRQTSTAQETRQLTRALLNFTPTAIEKACCSA
jgi:hypothetical protein